MMRLLTPVILVALVSAGCIQNMSDLKDRFGGDEPGEEVQPAGVVEPTPTTPAPIANATPKKAPVARMSLFAGGGALLYKSSFQADDPADTLFVEEKSKLSAIAGDSETLERGATIKTYAWTLNGKALEGAASKAEFEVGEAGLYVLNLTITDSNGLSDAHSVKLGVAPKPYDVVTELTSDAVFGVGGEGQSAVLTFDLALDTSKGETTITAVAFTASPGPTCDAILDVVDANGESIGSADDGSTGGAETITAGALPVGAYTITISGFTCAEPQGMPVTVTVTYLPVITGVASGGDEHGGHAH